jgi:excisionase family DNA binding protein
MPLAKEELLTIAEVAARLRVREDEVEQWLQSGQLHGTRQGGSWRITDTALEAFLQRLRSQAREE